MTQVKCAPARVLSFGAANSWPPSLLAFADSAEGAPHALVWFLCSHPARFSRSLGTNGAHTKALVSYNAHANESGTKNAHTNECTGSLELADGTMLAVTDTLTPYERGLVLKLSGDAAAKVHVCHVMVAECGARLVLSLEGVSDLYSHLYGQRE